MILVEEDQRELGGHWHWGRNRKTPRKVPEGKLLRALEQFGSNLGGWRPDVPTNCFAERQGVLDLPINTLTHDMNLWSQCTEFHTQQYQHTVTMYTMELP